MLSAERQNPVVLDRGVVPFLERHPATAERFDLRRRTATQRVESVELTGIPEPSDDVVVSGHDGIGRCASVRQADQQDEPCPRCG